MKRFFPRLRCIPVGVVGLIAATVAATGPLSPAGSGRIEPAPQVVRADAPLPTELQYVPHDSALFLHVDVAGVWKSDLVKSLRAVDKQTVESLTEVVRAFGIRLDDQKSVVWFIPKVKGEGEDPFGLIVSSAAPIDMDKLSQAVKGLRPTTTKYKVIAPSEKVAVVLIGLGEEFGKPQAVNADGPLAGAIKAAASGKHALVAGCTLASLPDALRGDAELAPFRPILQSKSVTATVTLGKSLDVNVRVQTARVAQARDAEKALAALAALVTKEVKSGLADLKDRGANDAGFTDLMTIVEGAIVATKKAKFEVDGIEARLSATLPLDGLPLEAAFKIAGVEAAACQMANNLRRIAIGMHLYSDKNNGFMPPASVCDKKGKRLLSWRVLILPYIEQNELYKQFKLDEPWDSEHNKKLLAKMPAVYAAPGTTKPGGTDTRYRVFVGNDAGFDWILSTSLAAYTDGISQTIMVVTANETVPWTKPDELDFEPEKDMAKLIGTFYGRVQFAMFDGSVHTRPKLPSKETLNAAITKSGGEVLGEDF